MSILRRQGVFGLQSTDYILRMNPSRLALSLPYCLGWESSCRGRMEMVVLLS